MLAGVIGCGGIMEFVEAKLTQVNLLLDLLSKVNKAILEGLDQSCGFTTINTHFEDRKVLFPTFPCFLFPRIPHTGHEYISVKFFVPSFSFKLEGPRKLPFDSETRF